MGINCPCLRRYNDIRNNTDICYYNFYVYIVGNILSQVSPPKQKKYLKPRICRLNEMAVRKPLLLAVMDIIWFASHKESVN